MSEKELSDWAVEQLEKGIETESLVLLAGMTPLEYADALELLKKAVSEMGYTWPLQKVMKLTYARIIADQIATGEIHPNQGCAIIGEINHILDWPEELSKHLVFFHTIKLAMKMLG